MDDITDIDAAVRSLLLPASLSALFGPRQDQPTIGGIPVVYPAELSADGSYSCGCPHQVSIPIQECMDVVNEVFARDLVRRATQEPTRSFGPSFKLSPELLEMMRGPNPDLVERIVTFRAVEELRAQTLSIFGGPLPPLPPWGDDPIEPLGDDHPIEPPR